MRQSECHGHGETSNKAAQICPVIHKRRRSHQDTDGGKEGQEENGSKVMTVVLAMYKRFDHNSSCHITIIISTSINSVSLTNETKGASRSARSFGDDREIGRKQDAAEGANHVEQSK